MSRFQRGSPVLPPEFTRLTVWHASKCDGSLNMDSITMHRYHKRFISEWSKSPETNDAHTHTPRGRAPVTSCAFLLWLSVQVWTTWVAKHTGGMGAALQNVAAEQQLWVPLAEFDDLEVSQNRGILSHPQFDHLMRRFLQCFGFGGFSQRHWWHISLETWSLLSIRGSSTSWCLATMDSVWSWANRPWPGQILGKPPPQAMKQQTLSRMGRTHETCAKKWRSQPRRGWQNNDNTTKCCLSSRLVADVHLTILRLQIWLLAGPMLADVLEPQGTETEWQFFVLSVSTPSFVFLQLDNLFGMFFFDFPCEFLLNWVISCYFCGTLGCGSTTCELQQQLCPKPISILSCSMCIIADVYVHHSCAGGPSGFSGFSGLGAVLWGDRLVAEAASNRAVGQGVSEPGTDSHRLDRGGGFRKMPKSSVFYHAPCWAF